MKKKITALLLSAQIVMAAIPICAAEPEVTYSYDDKTEVLSLRFNTDAGLDTVIAFTVKDNGGEFAAVKELVTENGSAEIKLLLAAGNYTLTAIRQDTLEICEKNLNLTSENEAEIVDAAQKALAAGDAEGLDSLAGEYADYLKTVKTDGAGALMAAAGTADIDTAEKLARVYNGFAIAAMLNTADGADVFYEILKTESLAEVLKLDEILPKINLTNAYEYSSDTVKADIAEKICQNTGYARLEDVTDALQTEVLFANLRFGTTDEIKAVLKAYADAGKVSVSWSDFTALSDSKQRVVIEGLKGEYSSYTGVGSSFDALVKNAAKTGNTTSGSSGGSSSGGGGSSSITVGAPAVTAAPSAFEPENSEAAPRYIFSDMENAKWANEAVECLYRRGVVSGVGDGLFAPERTVTRAEFTKMLMSMVDYTEASAGSIPFTDVSEGDWAYGYIAGAYDNRIVYGVTEDTFGPNDYVTREQAAVFIERLINRFEENKPDPGLNVFIEFDDMDDAADWAKDSILYLLRVSMVKGKENKNFKPKDYLTRAEAASLFYSYLVVMGREGK